MTKQKKKRNKIYQWCGIIMLGGILLIFLYFLFLKNIFPQLTNIKPVFWLESFALWAFGISWLVKGEVLLKDVINK
jgi:Na+/melibiose symporter-like transporter